MKGGRDGRDELLGLGAYRCNWRFSASLGGLGGCSSSGGYGTASKVRASAWH